MWRLSKLHLAERRMFGIGNGKRQRQAAAVANAYLEVEYDCWFGRTPPPNLATVLVRQSFNPAKLRTGDRLGIVVHAAEALEFGYARADLNADQTAMCAVAYSALLGVALASENSLRLSPIDRHCLAIMAQSTIGKPPHQMARAKLESMFEARDRPAMVNDR